MSKLKLYQVEAILEGNDRYATIVDYLRLVQKYGTKSTFSSVDPELLNVLRCNSNASVSGKLVRLWSVGLAERSLPKKKSYGKQAFLYIMK
ncbi:hypothetical protein UFOVP237_65 [uncultured Caudovirales phage]|uniref:Uncharacterized protein n=1 Tax=uncultured Caudovirales phage TaxID=2100421 RepID=A0A6J7WQQ8_9CAUD|nr:hypothetical protein UFOVP237_65 [uncultured Caudovirales phage]